MVFFMTSKLFIIGQLLQRSYFPVFHPFVMLLQILAIQTESGRGRLFWRVVMRDQQFFMTIFDYQKTPLSWDYENKYIISSDMKLLSLLVGLACLTVVLALIPLKKQVVGNDYFIGKIWSLYFMRNQRLLFRSEDDIIGFLNSNTGELQAVYQLDQEEKVVQFERKHQVIIARGKSLNVFVPDSENYMRLQETYELQKLYFNSIISFKRSGEYSFTLTDSFVVRMSFTVKDNSIVQKDVKLFVEDKDKNEEFFNLISYIKPRAHGVVMTSLLHGEKEEVCFRQLTGADKIQRSCLQLPKGVKVVDIVRSGHVIYVEFENSGLIVSTKFTKIGEIDQGPRQYYNGLVVIGSDHKYYDPHSSTLYSTRIIEEQDLAGLPQLTMKVEDQSMLIEKKAKDVVRISKSKQEDPRKVWAQWSSSDKDNHRLYIEFQDDRLVCYKIMESTQTYSKLWEIKTEGAIKEKEDIQIQSEREDTDQDVQENQVKMDEAEDVSDIGEDEGSEGIDGSN